MKFRDATQEEVNQALVQAQEAFTTYKKTDGKQRAAFLRAIADEMEALGQELVETAMAETNLPEARIMSERARTTGHCRMFADLIEEGSWLEARIDTAQPDRKPAPRPDLRKMSVPVGPVVVFGAANFPLAYSTAGGDTASALAAGCPVIVKAHPAHAATSELVASAIKKAISKTGMPSFVFQHLHGVGFEVGKGLVQHPLTRSVGFTGSLAGGKALFDLANQRSEPIPVFAEMSSINPVVLLPETLSRNAEQTARILAASITLGVGQFCTNPGLIFAIEGAALSTFIKTLAEEIIGVVPATMLHQGIADNYSKKMKQALAQKEVTEEAASSAKGDTTQGRPVIASAPGHAYLNNPALAEEVFGPFSLIIKCKDIMELQRVIDHTHGQLTATLVADDSEIQKNRNILDALMEKAGRLIINGVPTGVEVCPAMQHGGPYPATTDSRFTSVGTDAIKRFVRPVAFQNFPDAFLPEELKEENPLGIWRLYNGAFKK